MAEHRLPDALRQRVHRFLRAAHEEVHCHLFHGPAPMHALAPTTP